MSVGSGASYGLGPGAAVFATAPSEMKDFINARSNTVKLIAIMPAALADQCSDISIWMSPCLLVAECKPDVIPSAADVDNTARVQTVLWKTTTSFDLSLHLFISGVPVVLNTSFNDAGDFIKHPKTR